MKKEEKHIILTINRLLNYLRVKTTEAMHREMYSQPDLAELSDWSPALGH